MAKTTKACRELMENQQDMIVYVTEILRVKRTVPLENQANHVKSKSEEYWIGLADGVNAMLENALFAAKCYAGFSYMGIPKQMPDGSISTEMVGPDHPEYAGWRRMYYTK